jgi:hypothetical protein
VGVRLGGRDVGVRVADGVEVSEGRRVAVDFPGKFFVTGDNVGVGMRKGMKDRHASRMRTVSNEARNRIFDLIDDKKSLI